MRDPRFFPFRTDLGITAFSGNDGRHAFVHLAVETRRQRGQSGRSGWLHATMKSQAPKRTPTMPAMCRVREAALTRGEGGQVAP